jgi:hypothetical protein
METFVGILILVFIFCSMGLITILIIKKGILNKNEDANYINDDNYKTGQTILSSGDNDSTKELSIIVDNKYKYIKSFDEIGSDCSFYCMPCMAYFEYLIPAKYEGMGPENLPESNIHQKVEKSLSIKAYKCNYKGYAVTIIDQKNTNLLTVCSDLYGRQISRGHYFMVAFFETINRFPENIDLLQSGFDFREKYPNIIIPDPEELVKNIQIIKQKFIYNTRK